MEYQIDINTKYPHEIFAVAKWLTELQIRQASLVDKDKTVQNTDVADPLVTRLPELDVMLHYATLNHYDRDFEVMWHQFCDFTERASMLHIPRLLIVSGSQPRRWNSVDILARVADSEYSESFAYSVAYNPYLSDKELDLENNRVAKKLATGVVTDVYFQIGLDEAACRAGVAYIRSLNFDVRIHHCLVVPNESFLQNFSVFPWRGVFLEEAYLTDVNAAWEKTHRLHEVYESLGFDSVLFEVSPFTKETVMAAKQLL